VCGEEHAFLIRYGAGSSAAEAIDDFNTITTACESLLYESTVTNVLVAASGSNVANPYDGTWPVGWGADAGTHAESAMMLDYIGRSFDGRRVRHSYFGCKQQTDGEDFRLNAADSSPVAAAVAALNVCEGTFVSINGFQPVYYPYANTGSNAYWRNKIR
jgi:hypothetical protein